MASRPSLKISFPEDQVEQSFNYDYTGRDSWFQELNGTYGPPVGTFSAYIHSTVSIGRRQPEDDPNALAN